MNKRIIVSAVLVIVLGILSVVFSRDDATREPVIEEEVSSEPVMQQFANVGLGLAFSYRGGSGGYTLIEPEVPTSEPNLLKTIMLVHADDMPMVESPPIDSEGPPTITVYVFNNVKKLAPRAWAEEYQNYSNLSLGTGEPDEFTHRDADGLRYRADGLYLSQVAIIAHGDFIYVVNGGYRDESSPHFTDFGSIIDSLTFPAAS